MMPVLVKILVTFAKATFHPEPPTSVFWSSDEESPATAIIDFDGVLVLGLAVTDASWTEFIFTIRRDISVAAPKD